MRSDPELTELETHERHPKLPYARELRSIANLSRREGEGLLALAPIVPVEATVEAFPPGEANWASTGFAPGRSASRPSSVLD